MFGKTSLALPTLFFAASLHAEPVLSPLRAFVNYEAGQIEEGESPSKKVDRELINHASVWLLEEARLTENARLFFGVGGIYFFVFPRNLGSNPYAHSKRSAVGLTDAHGEFDFWNRANGDHLLRIKAGVFGYKYNEDAKNLGEYMFRTWSYPNIITTGGLEFVNSAGAQLSGTALNTQIGGLSNDLILNIQSDHPPVFGLSLTDIISYKFGGIFTMGAGFMFDNFYNPDDEQVTPHSGQNSYYTLSNGRQLSYGRYKYESEGGVLDTALTVTDTGYYTLEGQKAMVRAAVDLGKLLPDGILSEKDLRVYFEAILLGIKDYPTFYEKKEDRIAYMFGVNLPTFRLLDILSIEVEYFSNPFKNTTEGPLTQTSITPYVGDAWGSYTPFDKDDLKWTVYARKTIYNGFSIHAQVANDHIRMLDVFSTPDVTEFLTQKDHWYWVVKLGYSI